MENDNNLKQNIDINQLKEINDSPQENNEININNLGEDQNNLELNENEEINDIKELNVSNDEDENYNEVNDINELNEDNNDNDEVYNDYDDMMQNNLNINNINNNQNLALINRMQNNIPSEEAKRNEFINNQLKNMPKSDYEE